MALKQITGNRKLTEQEKELVYKTKKRRYNWKLCRMCGRLQLIGNDRKYCIDCGYDAIETVKVVICNSTSWSGNPTPNDSTTANKLTSGSESPRGDAGERGDCRE